MASDPWDLVLHGDYAAAIEQYAQLLEQQPRYPRAIVYANRAAAYLAQGDYNAALEDYLRLVDHNPITDSGYIGLGVCLWCLRQTADGVDTWRRGVGVLFTDAAGGVEIAALLFYAGMRLGDKDLQAQAKKLLRQRARAKAVAAWPGPIAPLLLGSVSEPDFWNAACPPGLPEFLRARHTCQAAFYLGVRGLAESDEGKFREHLTECANGVNTLLDLEYYLAKWEVENEFLRLTKS